MSNVRCRNLRGKVRPKVFLKVGLKDELNAGPNDEPNDELNAGPRVIANGDLRMSIDGRRHEPNVGRLKVGVNA
jgi:hypothetical protein